MLLPASAELMTSWQCLSRRAFRCINFSTPPQKKIGSSDPLHILHRVSYGCPRKRSNFRENLTTSFREIFLNRKYCFQGSPFTGGGPDAKILFLSTQRPPTAQKILIPTDLPFWRYKGSKFQLSHLFPKNWAARSPPYWSNHFRDSGVW